MIRNKLNAMLFVVVLATSLLPQTVSAYFGPWICADEAQPETCVLRRVQPERHAAPVANQCQLDAPAMGGGANACRSAE